MSTRSISYDWESYINSGLEDMPAQFRVRIHNVAVLLEDRPSAMVRRREGLKRSETLLGLYQGIPLPLRGEGYGIGETLPDTITLYREPIIDEAQGDPEHVRRIVKETIWHEFGHYFGLDEDELERREAVRDLPAPPPTLVR